MITSAEEFVRLRTSTDPADYERAAREPAPVTVWRAVITDHPDHRFWVAQNKTVPAEILAELADGDDIRVRWMVASQTRASAIVLERLSHDPNEGVRAAVARNPATPPAVRGELAADLSAVVREAAEAPV